MAFSFSMNSLQYFFISLLSLVIILSTSSAQPSSADLATQICSKTPNKELCCQIISPYQNKTLRDFAYNAVEASKVSSERVFDELARYLKHINSEFIRDQYISCMGNYARARNDMVKSKKLIEKQTYGKLPYVALDALKESVKCDSSVFDHNSTSEKISITSSVNYFKDVCRIFLLMADRLAGLIE